MHVLRAATNRKGGGQIRPGQKKETLGSAGQEKTQGLGRLDGAR
jgi:hypothetical protein